MLFKGTYYAMNIIELIAKSISYFMDSKELDKQSVQSDSCANSGA
jgi:hypothetical protein